MKAVVWTRYGSPDGLQLQEVERPVPGADQILIRVHATSITAGDCEMRRLQLPLMLSFPVRLYAGLTRPRRLRILGQELAGEVEQVGADVRSYKVGDQVFGTTGLGFGAYAEYVCLPEKPDGAQGMLAPKPGNLTYEEAAVVPTAGFEALHFLRKADIGPGKQVLIIGAGGSIGTFATQLASHFGADVTAVDSTGKMDMLRALGADHVIDYTREGYLNATAAYDCIIDVVGRRGVARRLNLLKPGGHYFLAYAGLSDLLLSAWTSLTSGKKLRIEASSQSRQDLLYLKDLLEAGSLKPIVDRSFRLEEIPDAHRYVEAGGKRGNVAITVAPG